MNPTTCDVCSLDLNGEYVDGKTKMGPWGFMCLKCHGYLGVGLGPGKGQKYKIEAKGNKKVAG